MYCFIAMLLLRLLKRPRDAPGGSADLQGRQLTTVGADLFVQQQHAEESYLNICDQQFPPNTLFLDGFGRPRFRLALRT